MQGRDFLIDDDELPGLTFCQPPSLSRTESLPGKTSAAQEPQLSVGYPLPVFPNRNSSDSLFLMAVDRLEPAQSEQKTGSVQSPVFSFMVSQKIDKIELDDDTEMPVLSESKTASPRTMHPHIQQELSKLMADQVGSHSVQLPQLFTMQSQLESLSPADIFQQSLLNCAAIAGHASQLQSTPLPIADSSHSTSSMDVDTSDDSLSLSASPQASSSAEASPAEKKSVQVKAKVDSEMTSRPKLNPKSDQHVDTLFEKKKSAKKPKRIDRSVGTLRCWRSQLTKEELAKYQKSERYDSIKKFQEQKTSGHGLFAENANGYLEMLDSGREAKKFDMRKQFANSRERSVGGCFTQKRNRNEADIQDTAIRSNSS